MLCFIFLHKAKKMREKQSWHVGRKNVLPQNAPTYIPYLQSDTWGNSQNS